MFKRKAGKDQAETMGDALALVGPPTGSEQLHVSGVSLLTTADTGPVTVPDLGLTFNASGVTVSKATGEIVRVMGWNDLKGLATESRPSTSPYNGVVLKVSTAAKAHRFVVPAEDPTAFEDRLAGVARYYRDPAVAQAATGTGPPQQRQLTPQQPGAHPPGAGGFGSSGTGGGPYSGTALPGNPMVQAAGVSGPTVGQPPPGPYQPATPPGAKSRPQSPALGGVTAPAGVVAQPTMSGKRKGSRRATWLLLLLLLIVAAGGGLYFAQKQGYIHFLPSSIVSAPATTAPGGGGAAPSGPAIPGLSSATINNAMALQAFTCPPPGPTGGPTNE